MKEVIETIPIKTQEEIEEYRQQQKENPEHIKNLDFAKWEWYEVFINDLTVNDLILRNRTFVDNVWMNGCEILGNLDNTNATFLYNVHQRSVAVGGNVLQNGMTAEDTLDQSNMKVAGDLHQKGLNVRSIIQSGMQVKGQIFRDPLEPSDIEFLKRIPLNLLNMGYWYKNKNWLECETIQGIHDCGTTYCIRGYAEAEYFIKNGVEIENPDDLYPRLKYLFYLTNEEAKNEIQRILNNN